MPGKRRHAVRTASIGSTFIFRSSANAGAPMGWKALAASSRRADGGGLIAIAPLRVPRRGFHGGGAGVAGDGAGDGRRRLGHRGKTAAQPATPPVSDAPLSLQGKSPGDRPCRHDGPIGLPRSMREIGMSSASCQTTCASAALARPRRPGCRITSRMAASSDSMVIATSPRKASAGSPTVVTPSTRTAGTVPAQAPRARRPQGSLRLGDPIAAQVRRSRIFMS